MSDSRRKRHSAPLRTRSNNSSDHQQGLSQGQSNNKPTKSNPTSRKTMNQVGNTQQHVAGNNTNYDQIRRIVQEEGRTARNLVTWNVPVDEQGSGGGRYRQSLSQSSSRTAHSPCTPTKSKPQPKVISTGETTPRKVIDVRARYWAFLFDNLKRAVDAIYQTCEEDESVVECKEVIMMLEQSTKDFKSLIERMHVIRAFEHAAREGDRPQSIAWEVRKMSPGKNATTAQSPLQEHSSPSPAQRALNFNMSQPTSPKQTKSAGNSWADRVRGIGSSAAQPQREQRQGRQQQKQQKHSTQNGLGRVASRKTTIPVTEDLTSQSLTSDDESEGWERVHRGGKVKSSKPAQNQSRPSRVDTRTRSEMKITSSRCSKQQQLQNQTQQHKHHTSTPKNITHSPEKEIRRTQSIDSEKENKPEKTFATVSHSERSEIDNVNLYCDDDKELPHEPQEKCVTITNSQSSDLKNDGNSETNKHNHHINDKLNSEKDMTLHSTSSDDLLNGYVKIDKDYVECDTKSKDGQLEHSVCDNNGDDDNDDDTCTYKKNMSSNNQCETLERMNTEWEKKGGAPGLLKTMITDTEIQAEVLLSSPDSEEEEEDTSMSLNLADMDDDDDDDLVEEALEHQLDKALASALDEEDNLSTELEMEQEQALASAMQQEESFLQEIALQESTEIQEADTTVSDDLDKSKDSQSMSWADMVDEAEVTDGQGTVPTIKQCQDKPSWAEMVEDIEATRTPGHGVHMHEKLSSPSRKRSPTESKKRHEERQAKAQELRERHLQEKSERLHDLSKKVEVVRAWKTELLQQRKAMIERKMQRAEDKRRLQLKLKAQKAHEEEAKANEIAFINSLEAQNKRHDIMSKHQESEARLQDMQEERQRRLEEKQAKEAAVEERRKALEADRKARLTELQEKRKLRETRIEQQNLEKEKERLEAVRTKEKEKQERKAAMNAQQQAHIEELQKKIQLKQDESTRRHQVALEGIQRKAFEMSVLCHSTEDHNDAPQLVLYTQQKLCTVCNVLIPSEVYLLSHLRGKKHKEALDNHSKTLSKQDIEHFNLKNIVDAPDNSNHPKLVSEKERQKAMKKRCKKLRQRMACRGQEYENSLTGKTPSVDSEHKAKLQKLVKDINKYFQSKEKGPWPQNKVTALDRALGEMCRIWEKRASVQALLADQLSMRALGGLSTICRVLITIDTNNSAYGMVIPTKSLTLACNALRLACKNCYDNCHYMLFSNKLCSLIDLLMHQLNLLLPDKVVSVGGQFDYGTEQKLRHDPVINALMTLLSTILMCLARDNPTTNCSDAAIERTSNSGDVFITRGNDIISYMISVGLVDKLTQCFSSVRGPIDVCVDVAEFLHHSLGLLVAMTKFTCTSKRSSNPFESRGEDPTQLISTFRVTELGGILSLLYGMLLHSGAPERGDTPPPDMPAHTLGVIISAIRMLNHMSVLDLTMLQKCLGAEGLSLEFRHICSYLLWYCSHTSSEELLHELILAVGYFTALNNDNQTLVQAGQAPTVLQQLCTLPFQYFSDPRLTNILLPTLIASSYSNNHNISIIEEELSPALLANFIEEKQLEQQHAKLMPTSGRKDKEKITREVDTRMMLALRFPQPHWTEAHTYFTKAAQ